MNRRILLLSLIACIPTLLRAEESKVPAHVGTVAQLRELLLATKWSWINVQAGVPERECVFMDDDTFRHPNFVAKFKIKDMRIVELVRKGGKAVLTFNTDYTAFEAIDFNNKRITGKRL